MMQKTLKIDQIKPNPDNPRIIKDDKFKKLVKSLQEFPEMTQIRRVVVNKDLMILGGNMRWRAAKEAGWTDIPVEIVDLPEDKQREFIIKDNVSGGEWDWDTLANEWSKEQLEDWGVDIENWTSDEVVEDDVPDLDDTIKPESKLGEVYQLGRHRLMCGDSTKIEDVEKLMNGQKADMVFTDPPYNLGYDYNSYKDNKTREEYKQFCSEWFTNLKMFSKGNIIITTGKQNLGMWYAIEEPEEVAVWIHKNGVTGGRVSNLSLWEPIVFYGKYDRSSRTSNLFEFELSPQDIGDTGKEHTCPKQIKLIADIVKSYSKSNQLWLDVFGGSGTTLIACEQTDRTCYMMELDEKYVDVIRKRYHKFITGSEEGWIEATPVIK
jgi:DNA modification methylase